MHEGQTVWLHDRYPHGISRFAIYQRFRRSLLPLFRSAIPDDVDARGRTFAGQLVARGLHQALQSHVFFEGKPVSIVSLLMRKYAGEEMPSWLDKVPFQQYWLRADLNGKNAEILMQACAESPKNWNAEAAPLEPVINFL